MSGAFGAIQQDRPDMLTAGVRSQEVPRPLPQVQTSLLFLKPGTEISKAQNEDLENVFDFFFFFLS